MRCVHPIHIFVGPLGSKTRKDGSPGHYVEFNAHHLDEDEFALSKLNMRSGEVGQYYEIPCGKCYYCRKEQAYAWLIRLQMETAFYPEDECCFLTLTYDDLHLHYTADDRPTIFYRDVQLFLKKLRKRIAPAKLRFFCASEYGDKFQRPHYHLCLFGFDFFADAYSAGASASGHMLFGNKIIDECWSSGFASFGTLDDPSAAYVAQYNVKKLIQDIDYSKDTRKPPFIQMSRRPGIGYSYLMQHKEQIIQEQGFWHNGRFCPIDRYMLRVLLADQDTLFNEANKYEINLEKQRIGELTRQAFIDSHSGLDEYNVDSYLRVLEQEKIKRDKQTALSARGDL